MSVKKESVTVKSRALTSRCLQRKP